MNSVINCHEVANMSIKDVKLPRYNRHSGTRGYCVK